MLSYKSSNAKLQSCRFDQTFYRVIHDGVWIKWEKCKRVYYRSWIHIYVHGYCVDDRISKIFSLIYINNHHFIVIMTGIYLYAYVSISIYATLRTPKYYNTWCLPWGSTAIQYASHTKSPVTSNIHFFSLFLVSVSNKIGTEGGNGRV